MFFFFSVSDSVKRIIKNCLPCDVLALFAFFDVNVLQTKKVNPLLSSKSIAFLIKFVVFSYLDAVL